MLFLTYHVSFRVRDEKVDEFNDDSYGDEVSERLMEGDPEQYILDAAVSAVRDQGLNAILRVEVEEI